MSINKQQWLEKVAYWKNKWSQFLPEYENDDSGINLYKFTEILSKNLKDDSVIIADAGSSGYVLVQSLQLKNNQRFVLDSGQMSLGAWPLGIGVCLARNKKQTIICTGDGSFNFCPHALATIKELELPIVIFVWNNGGYLSIRNTSDSFYNGRRFGTDSSNGLFFPKIIRIAECYGITWRKISTVDNLQYGIESALSLNEPVIVEVICDPNQKIVPGIAMKNGKPTTLDDMAPYISDEEMERETIKD